MVSFQFNSVPLQENGRHLHAIVCFPLGSVPWRLRYVLNPYFNVVVHRYLQLQTHRKNTFIFREYVLNDPLVTLFFSSHSVAHVFI